MAEHSDESVTRRELNLKQKLKKRYNIVHAIIHDRRLSHLERILQSGWDVNETLRTPDHWPDGNYWSTLEMHYTERTALGEAARTGWTQGVKMLLDAGAKCVAPHPSQYPLTLALGHCYHADIIELLLQHGADPNHHDDHDIPLLCAIKDCRTTGGVEHVQLLLEHGANPNVVGSKGLNKSKFYECPLSAALESHQTAGLFKMLIEFGADLNKAGPYIGFNLAQIMGNHTYGDCFIKENLNLVLVHGFNINMENSENKTLLEQAVEQDANSNNIRWLIRHGADTTWSPLSKALGINSSYYFPDTPLILLQAGVKVSHEVVRKLQYMEMEISSYLQGNKSFRLMLKAIAVIRGQLYDNMTAEFHRMQHHASKMQGQLRYEDRTQFNVMQCHARKITFPEHLTHQMADLQEFSDESLDVYPEVEPAQHMNTRAGWWQNYLDMIQTLVEFLSQPQSLQWSCRCCLRENLMSLQPSVVKSLPIPGRFKRYILCHEI